MTHSARFLTKTGRNGLVMSPMRAKLFAKVAKEVHDSIYESSLESDNAYASFDCKSGTIEVELTRFGDVNVSVVHENDHSSPTLEKAISEHLPDWSDVEAEAEKDMREEQEFRDYLWRNCRYM